MMTQYSMIKNEMPTMQYSGEQCDCDSYNYAHCRSCGERIR